MNALPNAEIYDREHRFMPWGKLIEKVISHASESIPNNGTVLDLACGTGQLLGQLSARRSDITCIGVDIDPDYIAVARQAHPHITWIVADIRHWESPAQYDVVVCTGGLHHLPHNDQPHFIRRLHTFVAPTGFVLVADPYLDDYDDFVNVEMGRKIVAAKLGYEYLVATIRNGADEDVVAATAQLIVNDVCGTEYKTSLKRMKPHFELTFGRVHITRTWPKVDPEGHGYGDHIIQLWK